MNRIGFLKRLIIGGLAAAPLGQAIATALGTLTTPGCPPIPEPTFPPINAQPPTAYHLQTSPIRGYHYRCHQEELQALSPGTTFQLQAEPTNHYDPHAVRVIHQGKHIGYLPKENNHHASRLLLQGAKLTASIKSIHPASYHWQPLILDIYLHF